MRARFIGCTLMAALFLGGSLLQIPPPEPLNLSVETVQHNDLEIPLALMNAIDNCDQKEPILGYLANAAIPRNLRWQYLREVREAFLPNSPGLSSHVPKMSRFFVPKGPGCPPKARIPIESLRRSLGLSDELIDAIELSQHRQEIWNFLTDPAVETDDFREMLHKVLLQKPTAK